MCIRANRPISRSKQLSFAPDNPCKTPQPYPLRNPFLHSTPIPIVQTEPISKHPLHPRIHPDVQTKPPLQRRLYTHFTLFTPNTSTYTPKHPPRTLTTKNSTPLRHERSELGSNIIHNSELIIHNSRRVTAPPEETPSSPAPPSPRSPASAPPGSPTARSGQPCSPPIAPATHQPCNSTG